MSANHKQQVVDLLKALETRDPRPFSFINPNMHVQHNLSVAPNPAGVAALAKIRPPDTKANTIRVFQDGEILSLRTQNTTSSVRKSASTSSVLRTASSSNIGATYR